MGTDIHAFIEVFVEDRWKWLKIYDPVRMATCPSRDVFPPGDGLLWQPFDRDYRLFGFLAGLRYREIPQVHPRRGLPADISPELHAWMGPAPGELKEKWGNQWFDCWHGWHGHSWATGAELLNFDYEREFEASKGYLVTVGDVLGMWLDRFRELASMGPAGPETVRIVYAFDS